MMKYERINESMDEVILTYSKNKKNEGLVIIALFSLITCSISNSVILAASNICLSFALLLSSSDFVSFTTASIKNIISYYTNKKYIKIKLPRISKRNK